MANIKDYGNGVTGCEITVSGFAELKDSYDHEEGNWKCQVGWCGTNYPQACECGGIIHANYGGERDSYYWLATKCDKCHKTEGTPKFADMDKLSGEGLE